MSKNSLLLEKLAEWQNLLQQLSQSQSSDECQNAETLDDVKDTLGFLAIKINLMDSMFQAMDNLTGLPRPETATRCNGIDWDALTYSLYTEMRKTLSQKDIEWVASVYYDDRSKAYRKALASAILKQQEYFGSIIAMCVTDAGGDISLQ